MPDSQTLSKPRNSAVVTLPKANRFTGKDAHAIAELLQQENPGLKFFHLQPDLKKPLAGSRGWEDCTADLDSLSCGVEFEGKGLAVVFGGKPYFALDVDTKKGHKGATNLCRFLGYVIPANMTEAEAVEFLIENVDTLIARSPSGGLHIYFKHALPFRAKMPKRPGGNDFRGPVGYLVAPGTHTEAAADPTGNTFTGTYEIIKDRPIAQAPQAILDSLVDFDAPVDRASSTAIGEPVTLKKFMDVIAYVNPDEGREKWIVRAGSFHNTNLVDENGASLDAEKLDLWLSFCRGEFWKGSKDSWIGGLPSLYTNDSDAEDGYYAIGQKEGGAGYGSLLHEARRNGYGLLIDDSFPDGLEGEAAQVVQGLMNANDYMAEDVEYRHIVYDENGDGVIPDHGIVGVVSPYASGKSTLIDELGYALATGTPWLGKYQVERRVVISCPLEDEPGSHDRMRAWCMAHYDKAEMPDPSWHYTWKHPLAIDDPEKLAEFAEKVNKVRAGRPVVFIVDTWQALISGIGDGQNDDGKIMGTVNRNLKFLIKECSDSNSSALAIIAAHPPKMSHYADETQLSWAGVGGTSNDATGILFIINDKETPGNKRLWIEKVRGGQARRDLCRFQLQTSSTGRKDSRGRDKLGMLAVLAGAPDTLGKANTERSKARRALMLDALVGAYEASTTGQSTFEVADLVAAWKAAHPEEKKRKDATVADEITGTLFWNLKTFQHPRTGLIVEYLKQGKKGQKAKFEIRQPVKLPE